MKKVENLINHIGNKIKFHRNLNKISLSQLSKDAGISKSTLFGLEEGRSNPTISTLVNIANSLNINLNDLIAIDDNQNLSNSKLLLISNSNCNDFSVYRLTLSAYEFFKLSNITSNVEISVINGEVSLVDKSITLYTNDKLITNSKTFKALNNGVTLTIKVYSTPKNIYTKKDILYKNASKEVLETINSNCINSLITRVIFSSIAPIDELNKKRYINYVELIEDKESHYYFYRKYFGLLGGIKRVLNKQNGNLKDINRLQEYINIIISKNQISYSEFSLLNSTVIDETIKIICNTIEKNNKNIIRINSIDELSEFNDNLELNKCYFIEELLGDYNNELNSSLVVKIYRALEVMEYIIESELNSSEYKIEIAILNILPKSLYYAYCGYSNIAIKYLNELLEFLEKVELDNSLITKRALKIKMMIESIIDSHEKSTILNKVDTIETLAQDLGLKVELKELISPVVGKNGLYCYIFSK